MVNATTIDRRQSGAGTGTVNVTVITRADQHLGHIASRSVHLHCRPPMIVSLVRFGFYMQQTSLVLTFSSTLDATLAEDVSNYKIVTMAGAS